MKWETISLGDIALRKGGSVDPKKHPEEVFELYSIPAFDAGEPEVTNGSAIGSSKKTVQPNDVMISRIVPHIRRACVVGQNNGRRQIASGEWIIFRDDSICPQYLQWLLVGDVFHSSFMRTVSGVGGSLLRARPTEVFKIQIPFPPLTVQKRIATIFDAVEALRAKRRESLGQLDTFLQSTFIDMLGDLVTNPMGWEVEALINLCSMKSGGTPSRSNPSFFEGSIPWVTTTSLGGRHVGYDDANELITKEAVYNSATKIIPLGSILVGVRVGVGKVSIAGCDICTNQDIVSLVDLCESISSDFLRFQIASLEKILSGQKRGATIQGITSKSLKQLPILVPPLHLQNRFATIVELVEKQKVCMLNHQAELDTLFASLQQRAFQGEL